MEVSGEDKGPFLVVIGREYGSGGRRIGKMLADALGVSYYDRSLLDKAASRLGYNPDIFASKDERRPSFMRSILSFTYGAPTANISEAPMSPEKIYEYQSRVIKDICSKESCVIVGRTADYVMRDHPNVVSLFIHAPIEVRARNIISRGETSDIEQATEIANRRDRERESYYNYFTNRKSWGRANNYSLSFDSSRISDEAILKSVRDILIRQ
ncbi:MAG: cytidylate kinase-like family protein [Muribaculaceae bacterium]|nr:cytidylate kinase-like family protein [Muribaculaceae bacterium]